MSEKPAPPNPLLKIALEFGPLAVFFFANARGEKLIAAYPALAVFDKPIFLATAVFMVASTVALAISWVLTRRLAVFPLATGIIVLVFGGLTLWLNNDTFIKLKPTIVHCLFGTTLLVGLAFGKSLLGYVFDGAINLTEQGWRQLTLRWAAFFFFLAALNELVWRTQTTDFWVAFKVWGFLPITLVFTMMQLPFMMRHMIPEDDKPPA